MEIQKNLQDYKNSSVNLKNRTAAIIPSLMSSGLLGYAAREVTIRIFAGFLFGGGVIGAAFTMYALYDTKKKLKKYAKGNDAMLEAAKIEGMNDKKAEEMITDAETMFKELIDEMKNRNTKLKDIYESEAKECKDLLKVVDAMIDKKIEKGSLSEENIRELNEALTDARDL